MQTIIYSQPEYKIIGAENYYFSYKNLYTKIMESKSSRHYYNKYSNLKIIEISSNEINNNIIDIILNIYNQWEQLHPNPTKSTKKYIINILQQPPSDLKIFIGQLNENNVYFSLTTKHIDHFTSCYSYGLTRYPKYHSIDLICILHILKYIKEKYNILLYYYLGYIENNKSLKAFKDKWADDKITIYKIYHKNFFQECNNILNIKEDIMEEMQFNDLTRDFIEDFIKKLPREDKIKLKKYVEANPRDTSSKTFMVVKSYIYNTYFKKTSIPEKKARFSEVLNDLLADE